MKILLSTLLIVFVMAFISCANNNGIPVAKQEDAANNAAPSKAEDTASYFIQSQTDNLKKNSLLVFVGEKIEITRLPREQASLDAAFLAKYKVLDKIYGNYLKDTIEFEAYDHYGVPPFSKYQFVLLFVSFDKGRFYHEKYQYFDLYKTKDGQWASPYSTDDYQYDYNSKTSVKPVKIEFADDVYYDVRGKGKKAIREWYPAPYYQVDGGKARAIYGNYIPELFTLKRDGVLTARELF